MRNEFVRLLSARANAKNAGNGEAQAMAFAAFTQPFHDEDLREEAKAELIGLMSNDYFTNLAEGSMQRRALDLLTLDLGCQYPNERDLMCFALTAYSRLSGDEKITFDEMINKLNDSKAVVASFEELLTKECERNGGSRKALIEKCLEEMTLKSVLLPSAAPIPSIHQFFVLPKALNEKPVVIQTPCASEVNRKKRKS